MSVLQSMLLIFRRGRCTLLGVLTLCAALASCEARRSVEIRQYDPRFAPVAATKTQTISKKIIRPVGGRAIRLEAAEDRVLGMHVPTIFKLKRRKQSEAFGQIIAKTRNIKAFYTSLGYQIVDQRVGLRIFPASPALKGMSPADKALAKKTYINLIRDKNLVWSLHIHAPPPPGMPEARPDPMEFIIQKLNDAPKKSDAAEASLSKKDQNEKQKVKQATTGRAPSANSRKVTGPRRINYVKPRNSVNVRAKMREWNKNHPKQPFLD